MTQINVIGQILDSSGYAIHTRNLTNALSKITDTRLTTSIPQGAERLLTDREIELIKKPNKEEINLIITNPMFWRMYTNVKRNWCYLVFEGDRIPHSWLNECLNDDVEYILVPSNHTKEAILNTANDYTLNKENDVVYNYIKNKIRVIPHGVNLDLFYPKEKPKDRFRFLCNKGFRHLEDRGGIQYAIRAYLEEFDNTDNVELVLKINPAYGIPDLNKLINEIKPDKQNLPNIKVITDNINYNQLINIYNQCNVLVAPSRADAFNLPCIEAMACGLPVITTNFGGQIDYCNEENSWIVSGEKTEVTWELLYEGINWITPNIKELRQAMRNAYFEWEKPKFQERVNSCLNTSKELTWDNSARLIKQII